MLGQQEHLNRNLINHENTSLIEEKTIDAGKAKNKLIAGAVFLLNFQFVTLIITAIVIQTIIKIELPLIKSYFKINSPVFVTQSVVYVTIFAKTGRRKVLFSAWKPGNQNNG